jgi:hypothetical protein
LALANAAFAVVSIKYREWMGSNIDFEENHLDQITNPFDPHMQIAPPGVKYTVEQIKHIGDLVNVQADEHDTEAAEGSTDLSEGVRRVRRSSVGPIQRANAMRTLRGGGGDRDASG